MRKEWFAFVVDIALMMGGSALMAYALGSTALRGLQVGTALCMFRLALPRWS